MTATALHATFDNPGQELRYLELRESINLKAYQIGSITKAQFIGCRTKLRARMEVLFAESTKTSVAG